MRSAQLADAAAQRERQALHHYLQVALDSSQPPRPVLILTHGLSGSGKTTASQGLLEACGAIRFRADVERKRLFGYEGAERTTTRVGADVYSPKASDRTYARLAELAKEIVGAGFPIIVDATFLKRADRDAFWRLTEALHVPFCILEEFLICFGLLVVSNLPAIQEPPE